MFDWSTPVSTTAGKSEALEFDWSQPVNGKKEDNFELKWSDDEGSESDSSDEGLTMKNSIKDVPPVPSAPSTDSEPDQHDSRLDIMAQQLKFIACLKILMGEMATLTTGFEVDGGQLRLQLYLWLDRELQVKLTASLSSRS